MEPGEDWRKGSKKTKERKKENQPGLIESTAPSHDENHSFLPTDKSIVTNFREKARAMLHRSGPGGLHELLTLGLGADAGMNRSRMDGWRRNPREEETISNYIA